MLYPPSLFLRFLPWLNPFSLDDSRNLEQIGLRDGAPEHIRVKFDTFIKIINDHYERGVKWVAFTLFTDKYNPISFYFNGSILNWNCKHNFIVTYLYNTYNSFF